MIKVFANGTEITNGLKSGLDTAVSVPISIVGDTVIDIKSEKPLSKLYFALSSTHDGSVDFEYYDGSSYQTLVDVSDGTNGLKSQGWLTWSVADDEAKDGDFYIYKITFTGAATSTPLLIRFIGIVFSEDYDLSSEYPNVLEYLPTGDTSLIRFHVAAKDAIVQWFRGKGAFTMNGTEAKNLTEYDFLDIDEVNQASKFISLAKIMSWLSDSVDDKYYQKSKDYSAAGYSALDVYYVSLDTNRDGKSGDSETLMSTELVIKRG